MRVYGAGECRASSASLLHARLLVRSSRCGCRSRRPRRSRTSGPTLPESTTPSLRRPARPASRVCRSHARRTARGQMPARARPGCCVMCGSAPRDPASPRHPGRSPARDLQVAAPASALPLAWSVDVVGRQPFRCISSAVLFLDWRAETSASTQASSARLAAARSVAASPSRAPHAYSARRGLQLRRPCPTPRAAVRPSRRHRARHTGE